MLGAATFEGEEKIGAAITAAIQNIGKDVDGASVSIVAGGSRGQDKNTLIAKVQAAVKRNPFYISKETREVLRFVARGLTSRDYNTRRRALDEMGQALLIGVYQNVERQRNPDGTAFKALTAAYAAYKRRKFGFVIPVLRATGDLLGGLKVLIDRAR